MSRADFVGLFVFLGISVFAPVAFALWCSRRARGSKPGLQECPHCGAQNHNTKEHCYCCGNKFTRPQLDAGVPTVVQRVKQAEDNRVKSEVEAPSPETS